MINLNGTSQYLSTPNAFITTYPFSYFAYFNSNNVTTGQWIINTHDAAGTNAFRIRAAGEIANDPVRISTGDGAEEAVSTSTGFTAGTWFRAYEQAAVATAKQVRINNGSLGTGATAINPTGLTETFIGANIVASVVQAWFSGSLAHPAIWNIDLSTTDRARLEAGITPFFVARDNLKSYLTLFNNSVDIVSGVTWAQQNSPTFTNDTLVKWPQHMSMMGAL